MRGVLYVTIAGTRKTLRWCVVCLVTLEYSNTRPPTLNLLKVSVGCMVSVVLVQKRQLETAVVVLHGEIPVFIIVTLVCRVRWVSYVYNKFCCVCVFRLYLSLSSLGLCSLMFWNTIPWFINNLKEQYMFDTILVGCFLASAPGLTVSSSGSGD